MPICCRTRETVLPVGGRAAAGHPLGRPVGRGEAIRIFTGAPMPEGADTVMMQEDCTVADGRVRMKPGIRKGANRRHAGEDVAAGAVALAAGRRLRPADLGLAAALGPRPADGVRPLRVALLSTGDEVREPGRSIAARRDLRRQPVHAGGVAARARLRRQRSRHPPRPRGGARRHAAAASAEHDLIVTSGGVSTGEEDHVKAAVERLGRLDFWRLAIKPGRPVALGQVGGVPLIGLPGNPVAVGADLRDARPAADPATRRRGADAAAAVPRCAPISPTARKPGPPRISCAPACARDGDAVVASKYPRDGAGILSSIVQSDGFVIARRRRRAS